MPTVFGLAFLILAGRLVVSGAKGLTAAYGIDPFIAGATFVALGTSMPELATAVISKLHGHDEIGLGAILGSNIFNGLFIVGAATVISPIFVDWQEVIVSLVFGAVLVLAVFPKKIGEIGRWRGAFLLALYAAFIAAVAQYG